MSDGEQQGGAAASKSVVQRKRAVARRPDVDTLYSINADGSRNAIHPADVKGRFQTRKNVLWVVLIGVYLVVPWLSIDGRPVLLVDIEARHFYLLGQTFNAGDFWFAFFFVTGLAFALFVVAALFGRAWCGYACPHTVFLEGVFRKVERWIEGNGPARTRLDKAPFSQKFWRRGAKLVVFLLIAAVITHSFLGYFMPVEVLLEAVTSSPGLHPTAFGFMVVATLVLFVNFTWFREQLCIVVCPYGRLQGVLYDPDTVLVGYDEKRGEPRGQVGTTDGDCVDCFRCVAVCPTGIDIRNGTQLECVGCANCIDACDEVMLKLGREPGLVRFDSQRGFETGERRFWRGRVVLYAVLLLVGAGVFSLALTRRRPFDAVLEQRMSRPYTIEHGRVHNVYSLKITNKRPDARTFTIEKLQPEVGETVIGMAELSIESLASQRVEVHVFVPLEQFRAGLRTELRVTCPDDGGILERVATRAVRGPSR